MASMSVCEEARTQRVQLSSSSYYPFVAFSCSLLWCFHSITYNQIIALFMFSLLMVIARWVTKRTGSLDTKYRTKIFLFVFLAFFFFFYPPIYFSPFSYFPEQLSLIRFYPSRKVRLTEHVFTEFPLNIKHRQLTVQWTPKLRNIKRICGRNHRTSIFSHDRTKSILTLHNQLKLHQKSFLLCQHFLL